MSTCQNCERKTDQFLCSTCTIELHDMLTELPQWVEWLGDTALGQTRSGHTERRSKGESRLLFEPDTESGRRSRQERASELFAKIHNTLGTIVRDLCESHGAKFVPVRIVDPNFIGPLRRNAIRGQWTGKQATACWWLAHHVSAVSLDESAGHIFGEIAKMRDDIDRIINPRVPMRWIGTCPTWVESDRSACGKELRAKADAIEVTCHRCRRTHNVARLQLLMVNDLEHKKLTVSEILELGRRYLPKEYQIPKQTLSRWLKDDALKPKGFKRPDGRVGVTQHSGDDEPLYLWSDVRKLRADMAANRAKGRPVKV